MLSLKGKEGLKRFPWKGKEGLGLGGEKQQRAIITGLHCSLCIICLSSPARHIHVDLYQLALGHLSKRDK